MVFVGNVQLVAGDSASLQKIFELLKKEGIEVQGNPDVYVREYTSFGVDEARELSAKASSRALSSSHRIFIVVTPSMTSEAQNALLKTLEEPSADAQFFIVIPAPQTLLPTLRSRAQMLSLGSGRKDFLVEPAAFLKAAPTKRLDMLKPLLDKDEDDKRDLAASINFLSGLEQELSHDVKKNRQGLLAVYRARKYLGDKGSLIKALLEQIALLV